MVLEVDLRVANDGGAVIPGDRVYFSVSHRNVPLPPTSVQQLSGNNEIVLEWSAVQVVGQALCSSVWAQQKPGLSASPPGCLCTLF